MLQQRITRRPRRRQSRVEAPPLRRRVPTGAGPDEEAIDELLARIQRLVEPPRAAATA